MEITQYVLVPVIVAVNEAVKKIGLESKWIPLLNIVLGVAGGLVFLQGTVAERSLRGLMVGLASGGFYDLKEPAKEVRDAVLK